MSLPCGGKVREGLPGEVAGMRWLIESGIRFRGLVVAAAAGLIIFGVTELRNTPVDTLPEFKPTVVEVQTEALGLSAEEVEQLITVPLEQDLLNGVAFLDTIESVSMPGLSSVIMTFEPGTDLLDARQVVAERLTQAVGVAGLPEVAAPPQMLQPLSSTSRVAMIKLTSDEVSPIDMSVLSRWVIGPRLLGVQGVAHVTIWGQRERQLQVLVDPEVLRANGVTLQDVISTSGNALEVSPLSYLEASSPGTGGFIDTFNQRLQVFHEQAITSEDELAVVTMVDEDGNPIVRGGTLMTLDDVSVVVEDHQPLIGDAMCTDGDCLLLVIDKFPDANTGRVVEGVEEALEAMRPGLAGITVDTSIYRPAEFVDASIASTRTAGIVGAVLVVLVLVAFFLSWRRVLVAVLAMATALAAAGAVLFLLVDAVNLMIIAGLVLALAVVIDDAIIDVENIAGRLPAQHPPREVPKRRIIIDAAMEMRRPVLWASLIIAAAVVPIFFARGVAGAFLPPLMQGFLLALAASFVVALLVTPALSMLILSGEPPKGPPFLIAWLQRMYDRVSGRAVGATIVAAVVFAALIVIGLVTVPFLERSTSPSFEERDLLIQLEAAPGTSLVRMDELTTDAVMAISAVPGVRNVGGQVGRALFSDRVVNVDRGEIWVNLDPDANYDATVAAISGIMGSYGELDTNVLTYSEDRIEAVLGRSGDDIVVRIFGENQTVLEEKAGEIRSLLAGIEGIVDPRIDAPPNQPTIAIQVDLERASARGIKPGDVRRAAAVLMNGITVGNLFEEQKVFDVVVWGTPEVRDEAADIPNLLIDKPGGGHVLLGEVADVTVISSPALIRHDSVATYIDVTATVVGRDVAAVAASVDRALEPVAFPVEHHAEVLQGFTEERNSRLIFGFVTLGSLIFIFLLLQATFRSWRLALIAFLTVPVAVVGGLLAILITGGTVALGSIAGLFGVFALATRQVLVSMHHYRSLQLAEKLPFGDDLVQAGTRDRLGPIVLSAAALAAALLPFALAVRAVGFAVVQPMAVVVLGGLPTVLILTLFVLPAAYAKFGRIEHPETWVDELLTEPVPELDAVRTEA